jgi:dual specificity phosphatase 12
MPWRKEARFWFIGSSRVRHVDNSLAGKSRSATIVAAYVMRRFHISVAEAISMIQEVRDVEPNTGFREQLQVYLDCNYIANPSKAAYRHWRLRTDSRLQKGMHTMTNLIVDATGKYSKPDVVNYATAGTVVSDNSGGPTIDLRCKKCRHDLIQCEPTNSDVFLLHQDQF